jgi:hypothetical protein
MSEVRADTITASNGTGPVTLTKQSAAKAWSIFDQVNSNTIDDSFNISTITDRGTGSIYGNYTNSMSSVNYAVMGASSPVASGSMSATNQNRSTISSADTASRYSMNVYADSSQAMQDEENQQALAHGDLA